jgi:membrane associated rhomboid family serine protease
MFESIIDDIKNSFRSGHMITRLIIINVAIFVVTALINAFAPSFYQGTLVHWIAVPGDPVSLILKLWTIISYMFVHAGLSHIFWNMLILYWFGRIVGDMIGDKHILPIYISGGLAGAIAYILSYYFLIGVVGTYMVGASAAIMALVIIAGMINPDKELRLILIGPVKIKFIILAFILMDLIFIGKNSNTGGHIAHIGGMLMGWIYYNQIGRANDIEPRINTVFSWLSGLFRRGSSSGSRSPLTVKFKSDKIKTMKDHRSESDSSMQQKVDAILDKINKKGYESLTDIEKETLYQASKK